MWTFDPRTPSPGQAVILPPCPISGDYILITRLQPRSGWLGQLHRKVQRYARLVCRCDVDRFLWLREDDVAIAAARKVVEANTDLDEKDMRNALNRPRYDLTVVRLYRRRRRNTNGLRVHSGIRSGFPVFNDRRYRHQRIRTKFIDPDYTITFIEETKHTPLTSHATTVLLRQDGRCSQPTAVDNVYRWV
jgi:hypothetical protein